MVSNGSIYQVNIPNADKYVNIYIYIVGCFPPSNCGHKDHSIFRLGDPELNLYFPLLLVGGASQYTLGETVLVSDMKVEGGL